MQWPESRSQEKARAERARAHDTAIRPQARQAKESRARDDCSSSSSAAARRRAASACASSISHILARLIEDCAASTADCHTRFFASVPSPARTCSYSAAVWFLGDRRDQCSVLVQPVVLNPLIKFVVDSCESRRGKRRFSEPNQERSKPRDTHPTLPPLRLADRAGPTSATGEQRACEPTASTTGEPPPASACRLRLGFISGVKADLTIGTSMVELV